MRRSRKAEKIIEENKKLLLETLWNNDPEELWNMRTWLFFYEEDAVYEIKALNLPPDSESFYLEQLHNLYGNFSEYRYDE